MDIEFTIRLIVWSDYELTTPILLQDENGPCPLIALINTLLLKTDLEVTNNGFHNLPNDELHNSVLSLKTFLLDLGKVSLKDILSRLGDLLVKFNDHHQQRFDLDSLLNALPKLHTGLSVNPDLTNGRFQTDLATDLFHCFNLNINHGWVYEFGHDDNINNDLDDVVLNLKYFDSMLDYLISNENPYLKKWLDDNPTQLTDYGLQKLNDALDANTFIVFFRNNHFSTLFKKAEFDLYLVITDSSFNSNTKIVWQSLNSATGKDDLFFSGDFIPILEESNQDETDLLFIKQLQEQEDEELAKSLQKSFEKRKPPVLPPKDREPVKDTKNDPQKLKKKSKTFCTIV